MTVVRQQCRNRNTMKTVSSAPSTSVFCTSSTECANPCRVVLHDRECRAARQRRGSARRRPPRTPSATSTVLRAGHLADLERDRALAVHEGGVALLLLRVLDARDLRQAHARAAAAQHDDLAKSRGSVMRPSMRTRFSLAPRSTRPAGTSAFSRSSAWTTMSGETPSASIRSGSSSAWISRCTPPTTRRRCPTPGMFWRRAADVLVGERA